MKYQFSFGPSRAWAVALASMFLMAGPCSAALAGPDGLPPQINARYRISLGGFDIGSLRYTSEVVGTTYKLESDVELSLLLGAFKWRGVSRTAGTMSGGAPRPSGFNFDYSSTLKSGSVRLGFDRGNVQSVSVLPAGETAGDVVPLSAKDLRGVLDPLSAILALTQGSSGNPCARKVSIFDGKQRFDLQLSYRRQELIGDGQDGTATVCRIAYVPISGYRQTDETRNMARNTGIEIAFRPVAGVNLFVPHKVVLPTLAGDAEITLERVDIKSPDAGQVALVN